MQSILDRYYDKMIINDLWNNSAVLKIFRYVLNIPK